MENLFKLILMYVILCGCSVVSETDDMDYDEIDLSEYGNRLFGTPDEEVGKRLESWYNNGNFSSNPEELGTYLEGDMLFPKSMGRNGMIAQSSRWTNGIIPFVIEGSFNAMDMDLIEKAISSYHQHTCIHFIPRRSTDQDYISIESQPTGCWSSVGRVGGKQIVNLQRNGCLTKVGTVMHELMHAVGFVHEQNREERDDHVIIQYNNIQKGTEINFSKANKGISSGFGIGYDYGSVMHYAPNAFSTNGQPTIIAKHKSSDVMGQRNGFSQKDIQKIMRMYKCKRTTTSASPSSSGGGSLLSGLVDLLLPKDTQKN